jgi:hypothetical protein
MHLEVPDAAAVAEIVRIMMSSQLEPVAFEVAAQRSTQNTQSSQTKQLSASSAGSALNVVIRFASLPAVVDAQIAQATAALKACATSIDILDGDAEAALWERHATEIWDQPGAIVRASWLPANIEAVIARLKPCATGSPSTVAHRFSGAIIGRAAIGAGLIHIDGDAASQARAIEQLRASHVVGNVVIVRGSAELKALVDVWGSHGDRQPLFNSLKRAFDPNGVLNAGRGPL